MSSETNLQLFPGVFRSTVGGENPGFFLHSDGRVGIGNKAPTDRPTWDTDLNSTEKNKLNVSGHTHIDGNLNVTGYLYGDGSNLSGVSAVVGGYWDLDQSNNNISYSVGNVGIGGAASTEALTVYGDLNLKSGGQLKLNGQTAIFSNWTSHADGIYRTTNVGIGGVPSATHKLKVHGTVEATVFSENGTDISSTYATQTALTNGLAGKQASGSYASVNGSTSQDFYAKENYAQNWFRVQGSGGIYWTQHGGGWYMNDSTWVRIYNGKSLWGNNGTIGTNGKMGIGTSNPYTKLHIVGGAGSHNSTTGSFFLSGWNNIQSSYGAYYGNMSIWATDDIISKGYIGTSSGTVNSSDRRIKKDILDVNDDSALEQLRLIKPKTYKYIDYISKGDTPVYGFIAQEVQETIPEATQLRSECIPNIYQFANVSDTNVIRFTTFNTTDLTSNTSTIEIRGKDDTPREVKITEVIDTNTIRVDTDIMKWCGDVDENGELIEGNGIFVYGEKVDDFVFLKKDYIFTIATAALQEVDRQLQSEKNKVATMELLVASLLKRVGDLENLVI